MFIAKYTSMVSFYILTILHVIVLHSIFIAHIYKMQYLFSYFSSCDNRRHILECHDFTQLFIKQYFTNTMHLILT